MSTLIIPDIHTRLDILASIEDRINAAERVIFLGDWFDAFKVGSPPETICEAILHYTTRPNVDMLWGNHDCHYAFSHPSFPCSGFNERTMEVVRRMVPDHIWRVWKVYTHVGPYLVSHAGFHTNMLHLATREAERQAIGVALNGGTCAMWHAGWDVGGQYATGGPTWLRWDTFDAPGPQVMGHTYGREVRQKPSRPDGESSYCIDTGFHHIMWIDDDDGSPTIERIR